MFDIFMGDDTAIGDTAVRIIRYPFSCFKIIVITILLFLVTGVSGVQAQLYPVQVTTQLIPPYSVYLSDYATPGNDKLRLVMLQRDLTKPSYQVRLQLSVELNGSVILRTSALFNPAPINLDPGVPMIITGTDLQPYVDSRNLDFVGISREEYERTKALPEGSYQICFTAYDYKRQDTQVSPLGCSFFWLSKDEPPLINFPACGAALPVITPQQIIFSWLPRNTSSPNSASETEYEFSLYETRPAGRNPNDVVLTSQPIYHTTTSLTQLVYSQTEPLLFENMQYVWRVRAIDKSGKDQFRNNGYSDACTFTYGSTGSNVQLAAVEGLQVAGEAEKRGKASWTAQQEVEGYKVNYKKKGSSNEWFSLQSPEANTAIFDLEPDTEYEVRVQAYVGANYGPYSDIEKFRTPKGAIPQCGDEIPAATPSLSVLPFLTKGMIIETQGIEMTVTDVQGSSGPGLFKGTGEVSIPYFGGAVFRVVFNNLFIDGTRTAIRGRIDFLTQGVEAWTEDKLAEQKKEEQEQRLEDNREQWKDSDFYEKVFNYDGFGIEDMYVNDDGELIIEGDDGKTYVNTAIPAILANAPGKTIIVEDKNGDQWVVQKDGKVTKVPGGGLSPTYNIEVSPEALNFVRTALVNLYDYYNNEAIEKIATDLQKKRQELEDLITKHNTLITGADTQPAPDPVEEDIEDIEPLFFSFVSIMGEPSGNVDNEFIRLSIEVKQKELERNRAVLLRTLGNANHIAIAPDMVAREMKIEGQTVSVYTDSAKKGGKTNEEIITKVKESIVALVDQLIVETSLKNLKAKEDATSNTNK